MINEIAKAFGVDPERLELVTKGNEMTTPTREQVNKLLEMIQHHFPSLPLDDRYTDWKKWSEFAQVAFSFGADEARADLSARIAELEEENALLTLERRDLRITLGEKLTEDANLRQQLAASQEEVERLKDKDDACDEAWFKIDELHQQLAAEQNIPVKYFQLGGKGPVFAVYGTSSINFAERLLEQLAASQLRNERLREFSEDQWWYKELLELVQSYGAVQPSLDAKLAVTGVLRSLLKQIHEPHDTAALDAYVEKKIKEHLSPPD